MGKFLRLVDGIPVMQDEAASQPSYDESIYYASGLAASSAITLPNSGSFSDPDAKDILVFFNDRAVEVGRDFNVLGAGPTYTQIEPIYDLSNDSVVRFKQNI